MPAVYELDVLTGLSLFMLAAVGPLSDIESVYSILKEFPLAFKNIIDEKHHHLAGTKKMSTNLYTDRRAKKPKLS